MPVPTISESDSFTASNGNAEWDGSNVTDVTDISVNWTRNVVDFASSSTRGTRKRIRGSEDVTGSFNVNVPDTGSGSSAKGQQPSLFPFSIGSTGTLKLFSQHETADEQVIYWDDTIITDINYSVPIGEDAGIVTATINFVRDVGSSTADPIA